MKWNQQSIHEWGQKTFGTGPRDPLGLAIRMSKETIELTCLLGVCDDEEKIKVEAADVLIVLYQVANSLSIDLEDVMKMAPIAEMVSVMDEEVTNENDVATIIGMASIELISALFHGADISHSMMLMAKIRAALSFLEEIYEFNVLTVVQWKMNVNEGRTWSKGKDGSFQHV